MFDSVEPCFTVLCNVSMHRFAVLSNVVLLPISNNFPLSPHSYLCSCIHFSWRELYAQLTFSFNKQVLRGAIGAEVRREILLICKSIISDCIFLKIFCLLRFLPKMYTYYFIGMGGLAGLLNILLGRLGGRGMPRAAW